jgi:SAM-dependent methyltransferase
MPVLQQVAAVLRRYPRTYRTARALVVRARGALPPRRVPGIPGPVHRNDLMYEPGSAGAAETYVHVGRSAVAACEQSLAAVGRTWKDVGSALDFGCGHGRVARHLAVALSMSGAPRLTVTDLDAEAVRFVAAQFSARGVISERPLAQLEVGRHDLVWAGSVATHLPEATWMDWIALVARSLNPGGLFVFTSHAPECLDRDFNDEWVQARPSLRADLERSGYAYVPYRYTSGGEYGLTAQTTDRLDHDLTVLGLRRVLHLPTGWEYQDVHAYQLPSS